MNLSTVLILAFIVVAFTKPHQKRGSSSSSDYDFKHKRHHHKHGHHHHTFHPRRSTSTTTTTPTAYEPSTEAVTTKSNRNATEGVATTTSIAGVITTETKPITQAETETSTKLFPASTFIAVEVVTKVVTVEAIAVPATSTQAVVSRTDGSVTESGAGFATTQRN